MAKVQSNFTKVKSNIAKVQSNFPKVESSRVRDREGRPATPNENSRGRPARCQQTPEYAKLIAPVAPLSSSRFIS